MHVCMHACMCVCVCVVCAYGDAWGVGPYEEQRSSSQEHCPLLRQCLSWWSAAHQWSWTWLSGPCGLCLPISGVIRTYQPAHPFCLGPEDGTRSLSLSLQSKVFAERPSNPIATKLQNTMLCILQKRQKNSQGSTLPISSFCSRYVQKHHFIDHSLPRAPFSHVAVLPAPQIFN